MIVKDAWRRWLAGGASWRRFDEPWVPLPIGVWPAPAPTAQAAPAGPSLCHPRLRVLVQAHRAALAVYGGPTTRPKARLRQSVKSQ
jgi:hypothetical protein